MVDSSPMRVETVAWRDGKLLRMNDPNQAAATRIPISSMSHVTSGECLGAWQNMIV